MIKRFFIFFFIILIPLYLSCKDGKGGNISKPEPGISGNNNSLNIPKLNAYADRTKVSFGDLVKLTLKYSIPEESRFSPETDLAGLEGLFITGREIKKNEIVFTIMADKSSPLKIGPVSLSFKDKKDSLNIIRSEAVSIEIISNLGNKPAGVEIKPIMDIIPVHPLWLRILPWALGFLLLAAIAAGIYYRKKRKRNELMKMVSKPPHVTAREEIEKLISMDLVDKGRHKEFYFRFSGILRQYLEKLRGFPAAESTTEEISRRIKIETDRKLIQIFREADLVKFADRVPAKAKNEEDIRIALEYIKETEPVEETAVQSDIS